MPYLTNSLTTWRGTTFQETLKAELIALPSGSLPLHLATTQGGRVDDTDISVTVLGADDQADAIQARVGVLFIEIVGGCNCHDDPIKANAYCALSIRIDKASGKASFTLIAD